MQKWPRAYATRLYFTDLLVVFGTILFFGVVVLRPSMFAQLEWDSGFSIPYWAALLVIGVLWMLSLDAVDSRDETVVGTGTTEYDRVFRASLAASIITVTFVFFFQVDIVRSVFLIFPAGFLLLTASRWAWRQWLRARQRKGKDVYRAIVIGEERKVEHIVKQLAAARGAGILILGVVTESRATSIAGLPVFGPFRKLEAMVDEHRADTVVFAGADEISPKVMRRIGWAMSDRDVNWIVAPAMTDIAGPRIHTRPVAGLPMVQVGFPKLDGSRRFLKRSFDVVGSGLLIVMLSPILLITALAVYLGNPGPVFYRQERIGRHGRPFHMTKFRSMKVGADALLADLLAEQGTSDTPLFKVKDDPRITRVGRFIRKYSIDELPQLFDVLRGTMSLVGPRPQREEEVALYDDAAKRRLIVKPGMSGLWQVSGRSELSWEDTIRLDLNYVENWSFMSDIVILLRTFRAVVAPGGSAH